MEKRGSARRNLQIPAYIETIHLKDKKSYKWKTCNVSTSGAFFFTNGQSLKKGTKIKATINLESLLTPGSQITFNGLVIRTENGGIGVSFGGYYNLTNNAYTL